MALKRSKKPAVFLTIIIFLMVGGAAAFIYVINNTADPNIEADIDAHFAAIETDAGGSSVFPQGNDLTGTDIVLHPDSSDDPKTDTGKNTEKTRRKKKWTKKSAASETAFPAGQNGITQIAEETWLIEEKTYRHAQKNLMQYVGSARAELAEDDHGPIGFKLKNINKNSYLRDIGLRGNDILIAINGYPLNSVENVTLAIASFQKASRFRLDLLRKGQKRSLYYKIVRQE